MLAEWHITLRSSIIDLISISNNEKSIMKKKPHQKSFLLSNSSLAHLNLIGKAKPEMLEIIA